jgi:hypothetical protein
MVRRVVEQLDGLSDVVSKLHYTFEELGAPAIAFRSVVRLDLELGEILLRSSGGKRSHQSYRESAMKSLVFAELPKARSSGPPSSSTKPNGVYFSSQPISWSAA